LSKQRYGECGLYQPVLTLTRRVRRGVLHARGLAERCNQCGAPPAG
jgi:hypothetical protein